MRSKWMVWIGLGACLGAPGAGAAPSLVSTASGDCRDIELVGNAQLFASALKSKLGGQFMDPIDAAAELIPQATASAQRIEEQLDLARQRFYDGDADQAVTLLEPPMKDLQRLPGGMRRWGLHRKAELLRALIYTFMKGKGRSEQANDAFRRVLRLDTKFQLDINQYPPDVIQHFERLRRELADGPRGKLSITATPDGAEVFLDGFPVGRTPYRGDLPAGRYQLTVAKGEMTSFVRNIELRSDQDTIRAVDLNFESAFHPARGLCFSNNGEGKLRRGYAARLASRLELPQVAVLWIQRPPSRLGGPGELFAALISQDGREIREGKLMLPGGGAAPDGIDDLADFLISGKTSGKVITTVQARSPELVLREAPPPSAPLDTAPPPGAPQPLSQPLPPSVVVEKAEPGQWMPSVGMGLGLGGLGTMLVGGGLVLLGSPGSSYWSPASERLKTIGHVAYIGGAAATAVGAALLLTHWLQPPAARPASVGLGLGPVSGGAAVSVAVSMP